MASNSEVTYGARLNNAKAVTTHLRSFTNYAPPKPDQTADSLEAVTTAARASNTQLAGNIQLYSQAVDNRQGLFKKDPDSLEKIMSPIAATVRSAYGKDSKDMADITRYVNKIRGEKPTKDKKDPTEDSVSQSAKSYGSMTENFSDMIATLQKLPDYKPANKDLESAALTTKLAVLEQANEAVTAAFGFVKQERDDRNKLFDQLNALVQRIKSAVLAQYGLKSTEYALIKGLKV